ncbi:MAG TPA: O-antigen ligase family protein [Chloroflexota bacterium]|nr:O-antigen ligase family protein [Chloroflexota bacterium]
MSAEQLDRLGPAGTGRTTSRRYGVETFQRRNRVIAVLSGLGLLVFAGALILVLLHSITLAVVIGIALLATVAAILIWQDPARGVYVLFLAAVMMETQFDKTVPNDWMARWLPFFLDISSWTKIRFIFSLAEIFMVLVLLIWFLRGIAKRNLTFNFGTLGLPIGLYMSMVAVGELHAVLGGGNARLSLWEIRAQVYMLVAYILACNILRTRKQIVTLLWLLVAGTLFRAFDGIIRYMTLLRGRKQLNPPYVFSHEEAFFLVAVVTLALIFLLYGGPKWLRRATYLSVPPILLALLVGQRRAALLGLAVAVIGLLLVTVITNPRRRLLAALILIAGAVALPPYYVVFHNHYGTIAGPARSIDSALHPNNRDNNSNLYRQNEDKDIMLTARINPIIGFGYGKPMLAPFPLPGLNTVSKTYTFWNILPHNSVLWVWMRVGVIGFVFFWILIFMAIRQSMLAMQKLRDSFLKGIALWIALVIIEEVILGWFDIQWTNYRNLIAVGILFGIVSLLTRRGDELAAEGTEPVRVPRKRGRRAPQPSLAAADGPAH